MKTLSILSPVILSLINPIAASTAKASPQYPYIMPECSFNVQMPEKEGRYYTSKDCKTVFILPPVIGTANVEAFRANQTVDRCSTYMISKESADLLDKRINDLVKKLETTNADDPAYDRYIKLIKDLRISKNEILSEYNQIAAATAQITFNSNFDQSYLDTVTSKNADLIKNNHISFTYAPISSSILSFTGKNSTDQTGDPAVIKVTVPGMSGPKDVANDTSVVMNGAVSAQLILSLTGTCPILRASNVAEGLSQYVVGNVTYRVPLKSVVKIDADLDTNKMFNTIRTLSGVHAQFSVNEVSRFMAEGNISDVMNIKIENTELDYSILKTGSKDTWLTDLLADLKNYLINQYNARLTDIGLLEKVSVPDLKIPDGGTIQDTYTGRRCESSGLFGWGQTCSNYTYQVPRWVNGTGDIRWNVDNRTNIRIGFHSSIDGTVYRTHTSTFVYKK